MHFQLHPIQKTMLDSVIDSMNLGTTGEVIKGTIKSGHYVMIPNITSEIRI